MATIDFYSEEERIDEELLRGRIEKILTLVGHPKASLTCAFVSKEHIRDLNMSYRGLDEATDILSFGVGESFPSQEEYFLGELVISLESMRENCQFFKVSEDEELTRLLVHGILHLLDWNHSTNEDEEPMIKRQEEIVKSILKE